MPKALLIDPVKQEVTVFDIKDGDSEAITKLIGPECNIFTTGTRLPGGGVVYVDDEGLLHNKNPLYMFRLPSYPDPLAGVGVVVGDEYETDEKWGWHDVTAEDEAYIRDNLIWLVAVGRPMMREIRDAPPTT